MDFINLIIQPILLLLAKFANYPSLNERIEILASNLPIIFLEIALIIYFAYSKKISRNQILLITLLIPILGIYRFTVGYTYDSAMALISLQVDILVLFLICIYCANFLRNISKEEIGVSDKFSIGFALIVLISTLMSFARVNSLTGSFSAFIQPILYLIIYIIFIKKFKCIKNLHTPSLFAYLVALVCAIAYVPYLFSPAPPDADIVSMVEFIGILQQGQSLLDVKTGFAAENFSIMYPSGFPATGWLLTQFLNVRGPEAALLLWIAAYPLVLFGILSLGEKLNLNKYAILALALNPILIGLAGLHGGQAQELLSYGLGIFMIRFCMDGKLLVGAILIAASLVLQPIVSLPFCMVYAYSWLLNTKKSSKKELCLSVVLIILTLSFLVATTTAITGGASAPKILLNDLTIEKFTQNAARWINEDSLNMPWAYGFLLLAYWLNYRRSQPQINLYYVFVWLAGAILIDGLFGDDRWSIRLQASCSTIAIWMICIGIGLNLMRDLIPIKYRHASYCCLAIAWIYFSLLKLNLMPVSVFTTHSAIRMGRYIEANMPNDILIANIRPPGDITRHQGFGFMMRANSSRNTIYSRISPLYLSTGNLSHHRTFLNKCENSKDLDILICYKKIGASHAVIDARPLTNKFVKDNSIVPIKIYGETFLIDLSHL